MGEGESGNELAGSAMRKGQSAWRMANQREFSLHHLLRGSQSNKEAGHSVCCGLLVSHGAADGTRTRNNQLGRLTLYQLNYRRISWSGRLDSNQRPSAPKADALPSCATPRSAVFSIRERTPDGNEKLERVGALDNCCNFVHRLGRSFGCDIADIAGVIGEHPADDPCAIAVGDR